LEESDILIIDVAEVNCIQTYNQYNIWPHISLGLNRTSKQNLNLITDLPVFVREKTIDCFEETIDWISALMKINSFWISHATYNYYCIQCSQDINYIRDRWNTEISQSRHRV